MASRDDHGALYIFFVLATVCMAVCVAWCFYAAYCRPPRRERRSSAPSSSHSASIEVAHSASIELASTGLRNDARPPASESRITQYRDKDGDLVKFVLNEQSQLIKYVNGKKKVGSKVGTGIVTSLKIRAAGNKFDVRDQHGWGSKDYPHTVVEKLRMWAPMAKVALDDNTTAAVTVSGGGARGGGGGSGGGGGCSGGGGGVATEEKSAAAMAAELRHELGIAGKNDTATAQLAAEVLAIPPPITRLGTYATLVACHHKMWGDGTQLLQNLGVDLADLEAPEQPQLGVGSSAATTVATVQSF